MGTRANRRRIPALPSLHGRLSILSVDSWHASVRLQTANANERAAWHLCAQLFAVYRIQLTARIGLSTYLWAYSVRRSWPGTFRSPAIAASRPKTVFKTARSRSTSGRGHAQPAAGANLEIFRSGIRQWSKRTTRGVELAAMGVLTAAEFLSHRVRAWRSTCRYVMIRFAVPL